MAIITRNKVCADKTNFILTQMSNTFICILFKWVINNFIVKYLYKLVFLTYIQTRGCGLKQELEYTGKQSQN